MEPMSDEDRRIRSYLTAQGAKLAPPEIVDKVRVAMSDLAAAARGVPPGRFAERPSPEEWSASEVLAHVVDSGRSVAVGIVALLDGSPGGPLPASSGGPDPRTATEAGWCELLSSEREALFARVLAADPRAHLDGRIEVSRFGPLDWREALLFLRLHDLDHAGQLRKIAAALG